MSRIALVGTINRDRIITVDGGEHRDLGGILYNALSMAPFLAAGEELLPIARLGAEQEERVGELFAPYPAVDRSRLLWTGAGTNETVLRYTGPDEREERLIERIDPLTADEVRPAAAADLVIANLIWGKELTPALLDLLAAAGAPLVLDIQSLTLTFRSGPGRGYRNIPEWGEWVRSVHTLKGNEQEMRWFAGEDGLFDGDFPALARRLLDRGPEVVIVTLGSDGSYIARREGRGVKEMSIDAAAAGSARCADSTGCGDAFTSGYGLATLRGEGPFEAALLGSALAALVYDCRGLDALRFLPDPYALREKTYGPGPRS